MCVNECVCLFSSGDCAGSRSDPEGLIIDQEKERAYNFGVAQSVQLYGTFSRVTLITGTVNSWVLWVWDIEAGCLGEALGPQLRRA